MSGAQAISRAKARRGLSGQPNPEAAAYFSNAPKNEKIEISFEQAVVNHDLKLRVFEDKIKELYGMLLGNDKKGEQVNEEMLSGALQSLDNRLDNVEQQYAFLNENSKHAGQDNELKKKIEKLESEQKELKNLLLKVQNMSMETNLKLMQIKDGGVKKENINLDTNQEVVNVGDNNEVLDVSFSTDNKKKGKK